MKRMMIVLAMCCMFILVACGGGGGSSSGGGTNNPPAELTLTATLTATPSTGTAPLTVTINTAVGGTATGAITYSDHDCGGGTISAVSGGNFSCQYNAAGNYTASVTVGRDGLTQVATKAMMVNAMSTVWDATNARTATSSGNGEVFTSGYYTWTVGEAKYSYLTMFNSNGTEAWRVENILGDFRDLEFFGGYVYAYRIEDSSNWYLGHGDVIIEKYDAISHILKWSTPIGYTNPESSIAVDKTGVYVALSGDISSVYRVDFSGNKTGPLFSIQVAIDNLAVSGDLIIFWGRVYAHGQQDTDVTIGAYSKSAKQVVWQQNYSYDSTDPSIVDHSNGLAICNNTIHAAAWVFSLSGQYPAVLLRYDMSGNLLGSSTELASNGMTTDIACGIDGVYITMNGTAIGPVKVDYAGKRIWTGLDSGESVVSSGINVVLATGTGIAIYDSVYGQKIH